MNSKLSSSELYIYFTVWIAANIYCLYKLFEAQTDYYRNNYNVLYTLGELKPGWRFISRLQDVSDIEWSSWKFFIQTAWFYLLLQFVVSEVVRTICLSFLKYWYIISSVCFIVLHMGYRQLIIITIQPIIFSTIIIIGGKKVSVWLSSILILASYNSLKYKYFFWYYLEREDLQDEEVYLLLFTIAWIKLRCISFCLDYIEQKDYKIVGFSLYTELIKNMFSYVMYAPLLYIGPIILYEEFEKSFCSPKTSLKLRLRRFLWDMFIFASYTFLLDCAFHYFYFLAMQSDIEVCLKHLGCTTKLCLKLATCNVLDKVL